MLMLVQGFAQCRACDLISVSVGMLLASATSLVPPSHVMSEAVSHCSWDGTDKAPQPLPQPQTSLEAQNSTLTCAFCV